MTKKLEVKMPKHLSPDIWKACLFIENAEDKQEASNRIEFLLKEKHGTPYGYSWTRTKIEVDESRNIG